MTDFSQFVLRWVLDDAAAIINEGKAVSGEYPIGEFIWSAALEEYDDDDEAKVILRCDVDHDRVWKCVGVVEVLWLQTTGKFEVVGQDQFIFNERNKSYSIVRAGVHWSTLMFQAGVANHKITLKLRITITSSMSAEKIDNGADPTEVNSAILVTDNKSTPIDIVAGTPPNEVKTDQVVVETSIPVLDKTSFSSPNEVNDDISVVTGDESTPIDIETVTSSNEMKNNAPVVSDDESSPIDNADGTSLNEKNNNFVANAPIFDITKVASEVRTVNLGAGDTKAPVFDTPQTEVSNVVTLVPVDKSSPTTTFSSPNKKSNAILVVGDKKLTVSKDYLAIHSPVFAEMFFGNPTEKKKKKIEINDVIYEELLDLLNLIFPGTTKITDDKLVHILKLASRFQMEGVLKLSEEHLMQSKGFDTATKILLADKYRIVSIRETWLQSFNSVADVLEKLSSPESLDFSGEMKLAICNRIMELNR